MFFHDMNKRAHTLHSGEGIGDIGFSDYFSQHLKKLRTQKYVRTWEGRRKRECVCMSMCE